MHSTHIGPLLWPCCCRTDPRAKRIVQSMHLWLVPTMNPDGFERRSRGNRCMACCCTRLCCLRRCCAECPGCGAGAGNPCRLLLLLLLLDCRRLAV